MEQFMFSFYQVFFTLKKKKSPFTSVVRDDAAKWFCCEAPGKKKKKIPPTAGVRDFISFFG